MKSGKIFRIFQFSHVLWNASFLRRAVAFVLVGFFSLFGVWAETWNSDSGNASGETTNYHKDNGDYVFNLAADVNWNGGLQLAADTYNVIINLNGYSLYIHKLYLGWVDASLNQNCNLIINGPGSITIDEWALATWGDSSSVSNQNSLTVTGDAIYSFPNDQSPFAGGSYDVSGGHSSSSALKWIGTIDTDWTNTGNWNNTTGATLSSILSDSSGYYVIIPSGCANYPVISSDTVKIGVLSIESGAILSSIGTASVNFSGVVSNDGTISLGCSGGVTLENLNSGDSSKVLCNVDGGGTISIATTASTEFNHFEIAAGTTVSVVTDFFVSGDWTNAGVFTASAGTATFSGSSQSVTGKNTWYNLEFNPSASQSVSFSAGNTQSVTGKLSFSGNYGTELTLQNDFSAATIDFNTAGTSRIILHLNGHDIEAGNINMTLAGNGANDSEVVIDGSGTVLCSGAFDYPTSNNHTVIVNGEAVLSIASLYGDGLSGGLFFQGDGTLLLPASGANLNWVGSDSKKITVDYSNFTGTIKAIGEPTIYTVSFSGAQSFSDTSPISMELKNTGDCNSNLAFPYSVKVKGSAEYSIDGTISFSTDAAGNVSLDTGSSFGAGNHTHTISTSGTSFAGGDGFTIKIMAPDKSGLVLGTCSWYYNQPAWTGVVSRQWHNEANWFLPSGISPSDLSAYDITINSGCTRYPEISSGTAKVKNLTVESGAEMSVTGGELILGTSSETGTLLINGDYKFGETSFVQTGGEISGASDSFLPAVSIEKNAEVKLCNGNFDSITTATGTVDGTAFSPELYISGTIAASSMTFAADKPVVLFGNSTLSVSEDGTINLAGGISCAGNELTVVCGTSSRPGTVTFGSGSAAGFSGSANLVLKGNANIYGGNTFDSFEIDNSNFTAETKVLFESGKTQKILNSDLDAVWFKGNSSTNRLLLNSIGESVNWNVIFESIPTRKNFSYVSVANSHSVSSSYSQQPLNIHPAVANVTDEGSNLDWFAPTDFIWVGTDPSSATAGKWEEVSNWTDSLGGSVSVYPDYESGGDTVTINTTASFSDLDLSLGTVPSEILLAGLTVNTGKTILLADKKISAEAIEVNGKAALYGNVSNPLSVSTSTGSVVWGDDSSIEYYGAVDGTDVLAVSETTNGGVTTKTYKKLILNKASDYKTTFENAVQAEEIEDTAVNTVVFAKTVSVSKAFTILGKYLQNSGEFIFNGTAAQTCNIANTGNVQLYSLSIQNPLGVTINGDFKLSKNLTVAAGASLELVDSELTLNGTAAQIIANNGTSLVLSNITVQNSTGVSSASDFSVTGNFTVETSSKYEQTAGNITFSGTSAQNITIADGGALNFYNFVNSNLTGVSASGAFAVSHDFTNDGTFTQSLGEVSFTGTASQISGDSTFYDLAFETAGQEIIFAAGSTQTVTHKFSVSGQEGNLIKLVSGTPGTSWKLDCSSATADVMYAELKDSENITEDATSAPVMLYAFKGKDSGNNSWWSFPGEEYVWQGTASTDWFTAENWSPASVPGDYTTVKISSASNIPLLSSAVDLKSISIPDSLGNLYYSEIIIEDGATLDLAENILTVGTIENYGTLRLKGSSGQAINCATLENVPADSSASYAGSEVEYYGSSIENLLIAKNSSSGAKDYSNLIINGTVNLSGSQTVTAENAVLQTDCGSVGGTGTLKFDSTPLLVKGNNISLDIQIEAENIVFYTGNVSVNAKLSSSKDMIVLGSGYSADDSVTGLSGIISYETARAALQNYSALEAGPYSTVINVASGIELSVGRNFYANGTKLLGSSEWVLKVPSNLVGSNCFLEAWNSEIQNSKVVCTDGTSDGSSAQVAADICTDSGGNTNWDFEAPEIESAKTLRDNLIYVKFNKPIRNNAGEILSAISAGNVNLKEASSLVSYSSAFTDAACSNPLGNTDVQEIYLKASKTWNTDATGTSSGDSMSTDRDGVHCTTVPVIDIPSSTGTALHVLTDKFGRRLKNYGSAFNGSSFDSATDEAQPVMVALLTGQENHKNPTGTDSSQEFYDSHNFIELRYSEPVNIPGFPLSSNAKEDNINVRVSSSLGEIKKSGTGIEFAGLCKIAGGSLSCGINGIEDTTVHALYRYFSLTADNSAQQYQTHAIRISIAGFVDSTVTVDGGDYYHWLGYIDSGEIPSGAVTVLENSGISDTAGNILDYQGAANFPLKNITVSSDDSELYGVWDLYPPVFAPYVSIGNSSETAYDNTAEIAGSYDSTEATVLNRMEFHVFDNSPDDSSAFTGVDWYTQVGWCKHNDSDTLHTNYSYAPDVIGGSRPFDSDGSRRSAGGIRYSSIYDKAAYFKYSPGVETGQGVISFDNSKIIKSGKVVTNTLFFPISYDYKVTDNYKKIKQYNDNLYFGVYFTADSNLPLKQTFSVSFDGSACITDLAGNRMRSADIRTIDSLAPKLVFSIAKVSGNELVFIVNKKLNVNTLTVIPNEYPSKPKEYYDALEKMHDSLRIVQIESDGTYNVSSDLVIDSSRKVQVVFQTERFTALKVYLNRAITFDDMQKYYLQVYAPYTSRDPATQIANAQVTFVQDSLGNYMVSKDARALSDFAVGVVNPVYAYDNRQQSEDGSSYTLNMYSDSSYAVHDWNASQKNYGTLLTGYDIYLNAVLAGCNKNSSSYPASVSIYLDNSPDNSSVSTGFNVIASQIGREKWRLWLPEKTTASEAVSVNDFLSDSNNEMGSGLSYNFEADSKKDGSFTFKIPATDMYGSKWGGSSGVGWKSGDQISFLFSMFDENGDSLLVYHSPQYNENTNSYFMYGDPFFSARLKNEKDLTSLDLWSFRLKDIKNQRGGVTILNNVINASVGEKVSVKVDMSDTGPLNVVVMTLDGNVVKYLQHGTAFKGEHFYYWDGTTKSGKEVARGLYFVRVFGSGIDETRKVMVVKD